MSSYKSLPPGSVVRTQTASARPPAATFSIAQWEQTTALPEAQLKLISELAGLTLDRSLPPEFHAEPKSDNTKGIETVEELLAAASALGSTDGAPRLTAAVAPLQTNASQHLAKLKCYKDYGDALLAEVDAALKHLKEIDDTYTVVAKKTSELHRLCEGLLAEERQLQYFAEELRAKLSHFEDIEVISSKFNSTALSVEDKYFMSLLKRLDDSVAFLQQNPSFLESQSYLFKFKQLQSRGLTLIRDFIINTLKQISHQIQLELKPAAPGQAAAIAPVPSPEDTTSLINVKFGSAAPRIQVLCREVETRAAAREYALLLSDIQYCYFQVRKTLLQETISKQLLSLMKGNDLYTTVRSGSFYLCGLCELEYDLHNRFFNSPSSALRMLVEGYSTVLYDTVRPVIVRSKDVHMLCTLVRILNEEIMQKLLVPKGTPVLAFVPIVQRLIEDSQERVIFVAEMYIRDEIQSYELKMKDINYPDILMPASTERTPSLFERSSACLTIQITAADTTPPSPSAARVGSNPLEAKEGTDVASESTGKFQDIGPFNGLARETTLACAQTLCQAARLIEKKNKIDGQLFLIKHMCLLNDEIKPFKIDFFITEQTLDFSHIYGIFRKVMNGELTLASVFALSSNNAIYSLLTSATPKLMTSEKDLKKDMDVLLSQTMESFIVSVARIATEKLLSFLTQASAYVNVRRQRLQSASSSPNADADAPLWQQPFAKVETLVALIQESKQSFKTVIPGFASRLTLYLENHSTKYALFSSIRQTILETVENFNALVRREYPPEELLQVNLFSIEDILQLLDSSINARPAIPAAGVGGPSTPKAPHRAPSASALALPTPVTPTQSKPADLVSTPQR